MAGYRFILKIRDIEKELDELGFRWGYSKHGYYIKEPGDVVSIFPKDHDSLPVYGPDSELFTGSIEEVEIWIAGIKWARNYDQALEISSSQKRSKKEQFVRNKNLLSTIEKAGNAK